MYRFKSFRLISVLTAIFLIISSFFRGYVAYGSIENDEIIKIIKQIFVLKSRAILEQDEELMDLIYDRSKKVGQWAFEYEVKKMKYIKNWSEKQGVTFTSITPNIEIKRIRGKDDQYSVYALCSTEYKYVYEDNKDVDNNFRIGTYHIINIKNINGVWTIIKEWYTDPFADSLNLENIKVDSIKEYILAQGSRDLSNISKRRIDAVAYADKYSGAANDISQGLVYNIKYKNMNPQGGDCANFASQILFEGGKFKKNKTWNYDRDGSRAWANAQGFKDYWVGSGRASVIAYGTYDKVFKASYKLLPGDFVAYVKKGRITHISVVTGADSKGYALVNCHNTDRHRVPWDLGWSNKSIKFYLVRVHF
ncbi:amidase domain-containing protein [Clostridium thermarum]|uniref:amidase domain-containing protein n=1 Tax=Clostridium thermarum TaxID=1716543 RepID=UPI0013D1122D|nr:amidase domain-containing protein [Clostridium thermarum]